MNNTAQELIAAMQMQENPEQRKVLMGFFKNTTEKEPQHKIKRKS